jgi:hypothetical protein
MRPNLKMETESSLRNIGYCPETYCLYSCIIVTDFINDTICCALYWKQSHNIAWL